MFIGLGCTDLTNQPDQILKQEAIIVVNGGENSISVINPNTFTEMGRRFIPSPPNAYMHHIGVNQNQDSFVFASPEFDFSAGHDGLHNKAIKGHLSVYNRTKDKAVLNMEVPFANHNAVFSQDGKEIWTSLVSHRGRVMVYNSENGKLIKEITVNADPHEVIFADNGEYALVACNESSFLTVISAKTKEIIKEIKVDPFPTNVWPGKETWQVIVENSNKKSLNFIDLREMKVTDHLDLNFSPGFSKFAPNGELWICAKGENNLYVFMKSEGNWKQKHSIATQKDPHQLLFLNGNTWLVNQKAHTVEVFHTETKQKIKEINVGLKPNAIVYIK